MKQITAIVKPFKLEEVREARLVPVIDFKGRRRESGDAAQDMEGQNR